MRRDPQDWHHPIPHVHDKEHVHTLQVHQVHVKEVAGQQSLGAGAREGAPALPAGSPRRWRQSAGTQDPPDRRGSHPIPQPARLPLNPGVAQAGFSPAIRTIRSTSAGDSPAASAPRSPAAVPISRRPSTPTTGLIARTRTRRSQKTGRRGRDARAEILPQASASTQLSTHAAVLAPYRHEARHIPCFVSAQRRQVSKTCGKGPLTAVGLMAIPIRHRMLKAGSPTRALARNPGRRSGPPYLTALAVAPKAPSSSSATPHTRLRRTGSVSPSPRPAAVYRKGDIAHV